ncbi:MAG TPA: GSCFA domain-containing protein [Bacteroidia bacterium]|jgi:hypothetical protein
MNFHLQFLITPFPQKINYSHSSLFIGSCFAENIAERMQQFKFNTLINPHGILYNPSSIANALRRCKNNAPLEENELFFANECWNSWEHHSCFSDPDKQYCLNEINKAISVSHNAIQNAEWLFITFGSAFVYKRNGESVGNCHKQPQKEFEKHLLSTAEIVEEYKKLIEELKQLNSKLKIVFTVSPVRYVRDGVVENTLSKARLIDAVHQLTSERVFYFPAYELVMDDLRDYRFYKEDLVHPNEQAIDYVFEKFSAAAFDEATIALSEKIKEIIQAKAHTAFNPGTETHKKFKATYVGRCLELKKQYPYIQLEEEIRFFS